MKVLNTKSFRVEAAPGEKLDRGQLELLFQSAYPDAVSVSVKRVRVGSLFNVNIVTDYSNEVLKTLSKSNNEKKKAARKPLK